MTNCDGAMLAALLRAGAAPDPQKAGGLDVFRDVAAAGQLGGAMMLVRHGLDLRWVDRFGSGHLETAVNMESFAIADELVRAGAPLWRVSMGGSMPVHALFRERVLADPAEDAVVQRMREKARRPGLPWPPPPPNEVLAKVLAGEWPTAAMREAGMAVPPATLAMLRQRARDYGQDGTPEP